MKRIPSTHTTCASCNTPRMCNDLGVFSSCRLRRVAYEKSKAFAKFAKQDPGLYETLVRFLHTFRFREADRVHFFGRAMAPQIKQLTKLYWLSFKAKTKDAKMKLKSDVVYLVLTCEFKQATNFSFMPKISLKRRIYTVRKKNGGITTVVGDRNKAMKKGTIIHTN